MLVTTTLFGRPTEVYETDQVERTEMNAMIEAKLYGEGIRKFHPKGVWTEDYEDPWAEGTPGDRGERP